MNQEVVKDAILNILNVNGDISQLIEQHKVNLNMLFAKFQKDQEESQKIREELNQLREQHRAAIEKENEEHRRNMEELRESFKQEAANITFSNILPPRSATSQSDSNKLQQSSDTQNIPQSVVSSYDKYENSIIPEDTFDLEKIYSTFHEIHETMDKLPPLSKDPSNYQMLLVVNRKQLNIFGKAIQAMTQTILKEHNKYSKMLTDVNDRYYDLYSELIKESSGKINQS
ncbi:hypothetical protein TRFO_41898 [Tritrichomonas foetus]|uniref:Uncharacterized protein n=1 Tax=Tritrichomonas foetus TaxID=1144522 RepID=A0A1J4KYB5_9EUKA|nr:hypothetical protein TRFO_41898 [Tritrichomonas foetus]|eukprot:OHT16251.1 hypothetical protein TRFO_41898 [Tritrichomonas foetus]